MKRSMVRAVLIATATGLVASVAAAACASFDGAPPGDDASAPDASVEAGDASPAPNDAAAANDAASDAEAIDGGADASCALTAYTNVGLAAVVCGPETCVAGELCCKALASANVRDCMADAGACATTGNRWRCDAKSQCGAGICCSTVQRHPGSCPPVFIYGSSRCEPASTCPATEDFRLCASGESCAAGQICAAVELLSPEGQLVPLGVCLP